MNRNGDKEPDAGLSPAIYRALDAGTALKMALAGAVVFLAGLWSVFSARDALVAAVESRLAELEGCPIAHGGFSVSLLPPRAELVDASLPGSCLGRADGPGLFLDLAEVRLAGVGFLPLGARIAVRVKGHGSEANVRTTLSLGEQRAQVTRTRIGMGLVGDLAGLDPILAGDVAVEASLSVRDGRLQEARLHASSDDLSVLGGDVQGIAVPRLAIGALDVRAALSGGRTLSIERADLGGPSADADARFRGTVELDQGNLPGSTAAIEGAFRPGGKLTEAVPLISLLLRGKTAEDGLYRMRVSGRLDALGSEIL